jgi:hypothetical protein
MVYADVSLGKCAEAALTHKNDDFITVKPTEPLRFAKRAAHRKRNCSDSSGSSPVTILASRIMLKSRRTKKKSFYFFQKQFFFEKKLGSIGAPVGLASRQRHFAD